MRVINFFFYWMYSASIKLEKRSPGTHFTDLSRVYRVCAFMGVFLYMNFVSIDPKLFANKAMSLTFALGSISILLSYYLWNQRYSRVINLYSKTKVNRLLSVFPIIYIIATLVFLLIKFPLWHSLLE